MGSSMYWRAQAAFCELLAMGFRLPSLEMAEALASGEYSEAYGETAEALGFSGREIEDALDGLRSYQGHDDTRGMHHGLRTEYTYLFTGLPHPRVSPYAGVWWAIHRGVKPLLFVNERSMGVERFMHACGIGQPEGKNEPLDHIATMLEFLQYVSLCHAGDIELVGGEFFGEGTFAAFVSDFLADWVDSFAMAVAEHARLPFYGSQARMLGAFMHTAWEGIR